MMGDKTAPKREFAFKKTKYGKKNGLSMKNKYENTYLFKLFSRFVFTVGLKNDKILT